MKKIREAYENDIAAMNVSQTLSHTDCGIFSAGLLAHRASFLLPAATDPPDAGTQPERSGSFPLLLQHASTSDRKRDRFCPLRLLWGRLRLSSFFFFF